jgi:hypothetical protein
MEWKEGKRRKAVGKEMKSGRTKQRKQQRFCACSILLFLFG